MNKAKDQLSQSLLNLENVEGSGLKTWMTGSSLMSLMFLLEPKEDVLEVFVVIFISSLSTIRGQEGGNFEDFEGS